MAFTVSDFQGLLRLLDQHPEWRDELRQRLLTPELLQLPALVSRMDDHLIALTEAQARTEQRVEALAEAQARTEQRVEALTVQVAALVEAQARTEQRIAALAEAQARTELRLEALTAQVTVLTEAQVRTERQIGSLIDRVGRLEGRVLEWHLERHVPTFFGRLVRHARLVENGWLADRLDDAVEQGRLSEAERDDVLLSDLVVSGRRRADRADVFLVAEISSGVGMEDVRRAVDRAAVLGRLGTPTVPVVAGERITPEAEEFARSRGAWTLLDGRAVPPLGS